jgi:hypothetical protein
VSTPKQKYRINNYSFKTKQKKPPSVILISSEASSAHLEGVAPTRERDESEVWDIELDLTSEPEAEHSEQDMEFSDNLKSVVVNYALFNYQEQDYAERVSRASASDCAAVASVPTSLVEREPIQAKASRHFAGHAASKLNPDLPRSADDRDCAEPVTCEVLQPSTCASVEGARVEHGYPCEGTTTVTNESLRCLERAILSLGSDGSDVRQQSVLEDHPNLLVDQDVSALTLLQTTATPVVLDDELLPIHMVNDGEGTTMRHEHHEMQLELAGWCAPASFEDSSEQAVFCDSWNNPVLYSDAASAARLFEHAPLDNIAWARDDVYSSCFANDAIIDNILEGDNLSDYDGGSIGLLEDTQYFGTESPYIPSHGTVELEEMQVEPAGCDYADVASDHRGSDIEDHTMVGVERFLVGKALRLGLGCATETNAVSLDPLRSERGSLRELEVRIGQGMRNHWHPVKY